MDISLNLFLKWLQDWLTFAILCWAIFAFMHFWVPFLFPLALCLVHCSKLPSFLPTFFLLLFSFFSFPCPVLDINHMEKISTGWRGVNFSLKKENVPFLYNVSLEMVFHFYWKLLERAREKVDLGLNPDCAIC